MLFVSGEGYLRFGAVIGHIGSLHLRLVLGAGLAQDLAESLLAVADYQAFFESYTSDFRVVRYGGIQRI